MGSDLVDECPRRVGREHEVVDRAVAARVLLVDVLLARDAIGSLGYPGSARLKR